MNGRAYKKAMEKGEDTADLLVHIGGAPLPNPNTYSGQAITIVKRPAPEAFKPKRDLNFWANLYGALLTN